MAGQSRCPTLWRCGTRSCPAAAAPPAPAASAAATRARPGRRSRLRPHRRRRRAASRRRSRGGGRAEPGGGGGRAPREAPAARCRPGPRRSRGGPGSTQTASPPCPARHEKKQQNAPSSTHPAPPVLRRPPRGRARAGPRAPGSRGRGAPPPPARAQAWNERRAPHASMRCEHRTNCHCRGRTAPLSPCQELGRAARRRTRDRSRPAAGRRALTHPPAPAAPLPPPHAPSPLSSARPCTPSPALSACTCPRRPPPPLALSGAPSSLFLSPFCLPRPRRAGRPVAPRAGSPPVAFPLDPRRGPFALQARRAGLCPVPRGRVTQGPSPLCSLLPPAPPAASPKSVREPLTSPPSPRALRAPRPPAPPDRAPCPGPPPALGLRPGLYGAAFNAQGHPHPIPLPAKSQTTRCKRPFAPGLDTTWGGVEWWDAGDAGRVLKGSEAGAAAQARAPGSGAGRRQAQGRTAAGHRAPLCAPRLGTATTDTATRLSVACHEARPQRRARLFPPCPRPTTTVCGFTGFRVLIASPHGVCWDSSAWSTPGQV
jgi:hypothetical protein